MGTQEREVNTAELSFSWRMVAFAIIALSIGVALEISRRSFWLDELATAWVIESSLGEVWNRALHTQGHSPLYYTAIWCVSWLFGSSELALRSLSLLSVLVCGVYLHRIAIHQEFARWQAAAALCLFYSTALPSLILGSQARPYGLAVLFSTMSVYYLSRWISDRRNSSLLLYSVTSVAAWYAHYLFLSLCIFHVLLLLINSPQLRSQYWRRWFVSLVGQLIIFSPAYFQIRLLWERRDLLTWIPPATIKGLMHHLVPIEMVYSLILVLPFVTLLSWSQVFRLVLSRQFYVLISWIIIPTLCLYILSLLEVSHNFFPAYFIWRLPGTVLLIALFLQVMRYSALRLLCTVLLCSSLLWKGYSSSRDGHIEDWRSAVEFLEREYSPDAYVSYPGLVEQSTVAWLTDDFMRSYFAYPIMHYAKLEKPFYIAPTWLQPGSPADHQRYWLAEQQSLLRIDGILGIVCVLRYSYVGVSNCQMIDDSLRRKGFTWIATRQFGSVHVTALRRD